MRREKRWFFRGFMVSILLCLLAFAAPGWAKMYPVENYGEGSYVPTPVSVDSNGPVFTQDWDWEAVNEVQYKHNGVVKTVFLPWVPGAATDIPLDIALDHKKVDGWVLLYNFMDGELKDLQGQPVVIDHPNAFFALYNKYRGIIRFFYFHKKETTYSDFTYGLMMETPSEGTTLLNFAKDFAESDEALSRHPSLQRANIAKFGTSGPILEHWHHFDVELAYDPRIAEKFYSDVNMRWLGRGTDTHNLTLDGKVEGSILGTVDLAGSNTNLLNIGSLTFNTGRVDNFNTSVNINQTGTASDKVNAKAQKQQDNFLKAEMQKLAKQLLQKGLNGVVDYATSKLTKIFNSFIGGSDDNDNTPTDNVNLKLEASINLTGTMLLEQPILEQTLKVPGTQFKDRDGVVVPFYDFPLGALTLSAAPEVIWEEWFEYGLYDSEYCYLQGYWLNTDSFNVILNPAVEKELRIKSAQTFLYYYQIYKGATRLEGILGRFPDYVMAALVDSDPNSTIYQGSTSLLTVYRNVYPIPYQMWEDGSMTNGKDQKVVVRVVVELERLDDPTADPVVWSKTYLPKYTQDKSQNPVRYIDPPTEIFPR
jgi:hypothetical protein